MAALGLARRMTRLLESIALGTDVVGAAVAAASASAALAGADNIIAHAVASAVSVASLGDLADKLLEKIDWLMAFIKIVTLFIRYLKWMAIRSCLWCKIVQIFYTVAN